MEQVMTPQNTVNAEKNLCLLTDPSVVQHLKKLLRLKDIHLDEIPADTSYQWIFIDPFFVHSGFCETASRDQAKYILVLREKQLSDHFYMVKNFTDVVVLPSNKTSWKGMLEHWLEDWIAFYGLHRKQFGQGLWVSFMQQRRAKINPANAVFAA
jgi:hypothetical protein